MTTHEAIQQQAKGTVHMNGRMVRGRVSAQNHPANPVLVITLPGGCTTTMNTRTVLDAINNKLILNW
jgi:hypothetical protein